MMKQFRASLGLWPILLFALACLAAGPARADTCSNPTGNEQDINTTKTSMCTSSATVRLRLLGVQLAAVVIQLL